MLKAYVYKEHTLGVIQDAQPNVLGVLRSSVLKGATFSVHDDPIVVDMKDCRPATIADFEEYRVQYHPDYNAEK